ncbi:hypothetical protein Hanom_Chr00s000003g01601521 [Helianthus anomalus]
MDSLSYHYLNTILYTNTVKTKPNCPKLPTLYTNSIFLRRCRDRYPVAVLCTIYHKASQPPCNTTHINIRFFLLNRDGDEDEDWSQNPHRKRWCFEATALRPLELAIGN